jgi:hypothetical protein
MDDIGLTILVGLARLWRVDCSLIQANLIVDFLFGLREVDDKKLRQNKRKDSRYSEGGDFENVTPTRRKRSRFTDFDEDPVNKSNVALELQILCSQNLLFFDIRSSNLVDNGMIDTRCNKYFITIYCILVPNPYESIIFNHIYFMYKMILNKCCSQANLDGCLEM